MAGVTGQCSMQCVNQPLRASRYGTTRCIPEPIVKRKPDGSIRPKNSHRSRSRHRTRPAQIDTSEPQGQRITRKPISHDRSQSPPEFLGKVIRGGLHAASLDAEVRKSLWIRVLHYHHCALADRRRRDPASCSAAEATKEHCGRADCIQGKFHRRVIILPGSFFGATGFRILSLC